MLRTGQEMKRSLARNDKQELERSRHSRWLGVGTQTQISSPSFSPATPFPHCQSLQASATHLDQVLIAFSLPVTKCTFISVYVDIRVCS